MRPGAGKIRYTKEDFVLVNGLMSRVKKGVSVSCRP